MSCNMFFQRKPWRFDISLGHNLLNPFQNPIFVLITDAYLATVSATQVVFWFHSETPLIHLWISIPILSFMFLFDMLFILRFCEGFIIAFVAAAAYLSSQLVISISNLVATSIFTIAELQSFVFCVYLVKLSKSDFTFNPCFLRNYVACFLLEHCFKLQNCEFTPYSWH